MPRATPLIPRVLAPRTTLTIVALSLLMVAAVVTPADGSPSALEGTAADVLYDWHDQVRQHPDSFGLSAPAVGALERNEDLESLARGSAALMARTGELRHDPTINLAVSQGSPIGNNIGRTGPPAVRVVGDLDVALDRLTAAWLHSRSHRQTLMAGGYTHIGVGVVIDGAGTLWATAVFQRLDAVTATTQPAAPTATALDITPVCPAPAPGDTPRFSDVSATHRPAVECLAARDVVQGRTATTFAPARLLTRAQAALLLDRLLVELGSALPTPAAPPFDDVEADATAGPAIARLAAAGIIATDEDRFEPGRIVTRGELAALLDAASTTLDLGPSPAGDDLLSFRDSGPGHEHADAIARVAGNGLLVGTTDGRFEPDHGLRRDHGATAVARLLALHGG